MSRFQLSKRLLSITRRVLAPLALSIVARVVFLLLGVGLFALGGWAVLAVPTGRSAWGAGAVIAALVVMSLLKGLARYGEQFAGHFVAFHSLAMLRNYFYDRLEPQAPAGSDSLDPGDLLNRVTKDIDRIEVFFAHTLAPVCTAVVVPAITLGWMGAATSWWLALVELCFLLVSGLVVPALGAGESRAAARDLRVARGRLAAHVTDSVQGVREVLAFGAQGRRMEQMGAHEAAIASSTAVSTGWIARRRGLNQAVLGLSVLAVALVGLSMVPSGALAPDQVGLAVGIALGSFGPVLAVEDFAADLDQAFASAERVFAVTDRAPLVADPAEPVGFDAAGDIAFTGVSFTYPQVRLDADGAPGARPEVLHDVTIRIPAGRTTAIVGASGSGKSTLAALLTRTWDPDSGSVSIGGVDIRSVGLRPLPPSAPTSSTTPCAPTCCSPTPGLLPLSWTRRWSAWTWRRGPPRSPTDWTRTWGTWGSACPAGRARASPWRAPCCATPASTSSTRRPARWIPERRRPCWRASARRRGGAPSSSSRTASPPSPTPTRSSSWTPGASSRRAPTASSWPAAAPWPPWSPGRRPSPEAAR